jgi:hypothetical protein
MENTKSKIPSVSRTIPFLLMAVLFASGAVANMTLDAHAQFGTNTNITMNTTQNQTSAGVADFKTLRDSYLAQWQQLEFQAGFDTFVEDGSVQGYGVYDERPSNIFRPDTRSIVLYVEPVGYGFGEGVDEEGNVLYSFNFNATIQISDSQGNPLTEPIPAEFDEPLNSHNKATEAFMPITLTLDQPLPIGEYTITYGITDSTSGKSFEIVKDIRVAETVR